MTLQGRCICNVRGAIPSRLHGVASVSPVVRRLPFRQDCNRQIEASQDWVKAGFKRSRACTAHNQTVCRAAAEVAETSEEVVAEVETLPGSVKRFVVTVSAPRVTKAWSRAVKLEGRYHDFPGFRQGKKVPEALVLQRAGKEAVVQRAMSMVISESLPTVTGKYAPNSYEDSLRIETPADMAEKFNKDKDFTYACNITMQPEVKWKGDYKKLKISVEPRLTEEEIRSAAEEKVKIALKEVGSLRIVQGRGLEKGDVAIIDIQLSRKDTGEVIEGTKQIGKQVDTAMERTIDLPGFLDDLMGMVPGDEKTLEYTLPDTWWEPAIQGTVVIAELALKELFVWELPKLTDQVAKMLLPESKDVQDFSEKIMEAEATVSEADHLAELQGTVCKTIAQMVDIDIPEWLFRTIAENEYQAELLANQAKGALTKEQIEQLATQEMLEKYTETNKEDLTQMVKVTVAMEDLWQREGMEITPEEAQEELKDALEEAQRSGGDIDENRLRDQVQEALKGAKIISWLIDNADITYTTEDEEGIVDTTSRDA